MKHARLFQVDCPFEPVYLLNIKLCIDCGVQVFHSGLVLLSPTNYRSFCLAWMQFWFSLMCCLFVRTQPFFLLLPIDIKMAFFIASGKDIDVCVHE